jgi:aarF domain-containing kinase
LIDFGALREYPDGFVNSYQRLVVAASNGDRATLLQESVNLGFLTGNESKSMLDAHCDAGMIGTPCVSPLRMLSQTFLQSGSRSDPQGRTTSRAAT